MLEDERGQNMGKAPVSQVLAMNNVTDDQDHFKEDQP